MTTTKVESKAQLLTLIDEVFGVKLPTRRASTGICER